MKKLLYAITVLTIAQSTISSEVKAQSWQWATPAGSKNTDTKADRVSDLATDASGNSYLLSTIHSKEIYVAGTSLPDGKGYSPSTHTMLSSLDAAGKYRWSKVIGANSTNPKQVKLSRIGNVYIVGDVVSAPGYPAHYDLDKTTPDYASNMSLICYDLNGNFKWLVRPDTMLGPATKDYQAMSVDIDDAGNSYLLVSMPPGSKIMGSSMIIPSTPPFKGAGIYVLKYNPSGGLLAVTMMKDFSYTTLSTTISSSLKICYNKLNGGFYISGTAFPDPGGDSLYIKSKYVEHNIFLLSYASNGTLKWNITDTATFYGTNSVVDPVTLDDNGNIFMAANCTDKNMFNGYLFKNDIFPGSPYGMPFIMKMDSTGKFKWCTNGGGKSFAIQSGFSINKKFAAIGVIGALKNYFGDINRDTIIANVSGDGQDGWYAIVDLDFGKTVKLGKIKGNGFYDAIRAVRFNKDDLYMAGHFESSSLVMDESGISVGPAKSGWDVYVSKFSTSGLVSVEEIIPTVRNVRIYPNPANDLLYIDGAEMGTVLTLLTISGQQVYSGTATETITQIPVSNLANGMYLLQLQDKDGKVYTSKILKQ